MALTSSLNQEYLQHMPSRAHWVTRLTLLLALSLAPSGYVFAQQPKPVITTPTPAPVDPASQAVALGLVPMAYLPLTVGGSGEVFHDVNPASFAYTVQPEDTLWSLALDFGRDLDTMSCVTRPLGPDAETLVVGETVIVPALVDLCYTVRPGDTLAGIAARFGIPIEAIVAVPWNGFDSPPYTVEARQRVLLPGARGIALDRPDRESVSRAEDAWANSPWPDWRYGDGQFVWPVIGPISQYAHAGHWAIDIAVPTGTPVQAVDRGTVIFAGWNGSGYGFRVIIDHGNDYVSLYAHLSDIYVEVGQVVGKEQVIGASGANGNITGPHLHFEIRDFGILRNPLELLPAAP